MSAFMRQERSRDDESTPSADVVYDSFDAKISAWERAVGVVSLVLNTEFVITNGSVRSFDALFGDSVTL